MVKINLLDVGPAQVGLGMETDAAYLFVCPWVAMGRTRILKRVAIVVRTGDGATRVRKVQDWQEER